MWRSVPLTGQYGLQIVRSQGDLPQAAGERLETGTGYEIFPTVRIREYRTLAKSISPAIPVDSAPSYPSLGPPPLKPRPSATLSRTARVGH